MKKANGNIDHFFRENLEPGAPTTIAIKGTGPLESIETPFQKIDIYDTVQFGKMLALDGIIQLTQSDNCNYHEMIAHVPLNTHPKPRKVLIIGGGDGGTLKEVLKHSCIQKVVWCEIDEKVIEISKKYFPELASNLNNTRVTLLIQDAVAYIKTKQNYFDVICVDSSDPIGPAVKLFEKEFYQDMYKALTEDGIAVAQGESMFYHADEICEWVQRNKEIFAYSAYYHTHVPTYPSGMIGFLFCSKKYDPYTNIDPDRIAKLADLRYYSADMHHASFVLPAFLTKKLAVYEK